MDAGNMKRVLFVAYLFPPVGGAGVQRTTKFVKYLPEHGWLPSVLTVSNPSVPAWDQSLLREVPESVTVRRARTWEPSYAAKAAVSARTPENGARAGSSNGLGLKAALKATAHRMAKLLLQPDPQVLWVPEAIQ